MGSFGLVAEVGLKPASVLWGVYLAGLVRRLWPVEDTDERVAGSL